MESLRGRSPSPYGQKPERSETGGRRTPNMDAAGEVSKDSRSRTSSSSECPHMSPMPARSNMGTTSSSHAVESGNEGLTDKGTSAAGDGLERRVTGDEPPIHELKFENEVLRQQLLHAKVARSDLEKENEALKEMLEQHTTGSLSPLSHASDTIPAALGSPKLKPVPLPRKHLDKQVSVECSKQPRLDMTLAGTTVLPTSLSSSSVLTSAEALPVKPPRRKAKEQKNSTKPPLPPYPAPGKLDGGTKSSSDGGGVPSLQSPHPPSAQLPRQWHHPPLAPSHSSVLVSSSPGINKRITPIKHDSSWITSRYPIATSVARTPPHINPVVPAANGTIPGNAPANGTISATKSSELSSSSVEPGDQPGDQPKSKAQRQRKFSFLRRPRPEVLPNTAEASTEGVASPQRDKITESFNMADSKPKKAAKKQLTMSPDHERPVSMAENTSVSVEVWRGWLYVWDGYMCGRVIWGASVYVDECM